MNKFRCDLINAFDNWVVKMKQTFPNIREDEFGHGLQRTVSGRARVKGKEHVNHWIEENKKKWAVTLEKWRDNGGEKTLVQLTFAAKMKAGISHVPVPCSVCRTVHAGTTVIRSFYGRGAASGCLWKVFLRYYYLTNKKGAAQVTIRQENTWVIKELDGAIIRHLDFEEIVQSLIAGEPRIKEITLIKH